MTDQLPGLTPTLLTDDDQPSSAGPVLPTHLSVTKIGTGFVFHTLIIIATGVHCSCCQHSTISSQKTLFCSAENSDLEATFVSLYVDLAYISLHCCLSVIEMIDNLIQLR